MLVTNGLDKMFELSLDYEYLQQHRKVVGIQGSWDAYFTLLTNAVGSVQFTESGELIVFYPLMEGAKIRGVFES